MQLVSLIRRDPVLRPTGVVVLSSDVLGLTNRLRDLGVTDYLMKPVKRADLHQAIAAAVAVRDAAMAVTGGPGPALPADPEVESLRALPLRILFVDDSEDNRFLVLAHLGRTLHDVTVATNGAEAVHAFENADEPFDLILMDMQMPVLDGYEATRQIRQIEHERASGNTIIIALTAFALKEEISKSIEAGCDDHLTKPIKRTLVSLVQGGLSVLSPTSIGRSRLSYRASCSAGGMTPNSLSRLSPLGTLRLSCRWHIRSRALAAATGSIRSLSTDRQSNERLRQVTARP